MTMITCVSPVNGEVYAERPALSFEAATDAVTRARKAQKDWARRPLEDRVQLVLKGCARLNEMADVVVPELAWQMGRPIKYGGEYRGFNERSNYVATIAADALAPHTRLDAESDLRQCVGGLIGRMQLSRAAHHAVLDIGDDDGTVVGAFRGITFDKTVIHEAVEAIMTASPIKPQQMIAQQRQLFLLA